MTERIQRELAILSEGGQRAALVLAQNRRFVIYYAVPTAGAALALPAETDVIVPVPDPYPPMIIDGAGLPIGSTLLPRVKGGQNNQGHVEADGRTWQLASYHPHNNGGGPPWNPTVHGFHTYLDEVLAWLGRLT